MFDPIQHQRKAPNSDLLTDVTHHVAPVAQHTTYPMAPDQGDEDTRIFSNPVHESVAPLNRPGSLRSDFVAADAANRVNSRLPVWSSHVSKPLSDRKAIIRRRVICGIATAVFLAVLGAGVFFGVKLLTRPKAPAGLNDDHRRVSRTDDGGPATCSKKGGLATLSHDEPPHFQQLRNITQDLTHIKNGSSTVVLLMQFINAEVDPILQQVVKAANATVGPTLDIQQLTPKQIFSFLADKAHAGWISDPRYLTWLSPLAALNNTTPVQLAGFDFLSSINGFYYAPYGNMLMIEFGNVTRIQVKAFLEALAARTDLIKSVQEERTISKLSTLTKANDPALNKQWGMHSVGILPENGFTGQPGWAVTTGSKSIIVAIMDTGVDASHPDLAPNLWVNTAERDGKPGRDNDGNTFPGDVHGWNFVERSANLVDADPEGHGTHVAGIIGAVANNGAYGAGVAPVVSLMICKVLGDDGRGKNTYLIAAMNYALSMGAQITSHSLSSDDHNVDKSLDTVLAAAEREGQLLVAAAGNARVNNDVTPTYPAGYKRSNIISVGWMDRYGCFDKNGNYGKKSVHLLAPGTAILSTYPTKQPSPIGVVGMNILGGSSQAVPHVTGAAVLVLAAWEAQGKNFEGQAKTLRRILLDSVDKDSALEDFSITGGRLNVARALALASNTTLPPPARSRAQLSHTSTSQALWLAALFTLLACHVLIRD